MTNLDWRRVEPHSTYFVRGSLLVLIMALGCSKAPSRVVQDRPAGNSGAQAIALHDKDKDGFLSGAELDAAPGLKAALPQVDANQDSKISPDEITARVNAWAKSGVGRMTVVCLVTHNGAPLDGAEVKLVPESFLGDNLKAAVGNTAQGTAMPKVPMDDVSGVGPGFYRIEITAPMGIPEKYNTQTTLGTEVSAEALRGGPLRFEVGN